MTMTLVSDNELLGRLRQLEWSGDLCLPIPPQSVIEFSTRARQPDVTIPELGRIIEYEPELTVQLLKNVNSALTGLKNEIHSVTQAISLLGIAQSTTILLSSALSQAVANIESPLVAAGDFRRETIERALFARETALKLGLDGILAYTSAMLQDILLPLLTRQFQVDYHDYLHSGQYESLSRFERKRFGWTHAELAAKTLLNWGFPEPLILAVLQHHTSPEQLLVSSEDLPGAFPACVAGLLMDGLNQSPDGVTRLVDLQGIDQRFQLNEIATLVDSTISDCHGRLQHPVSLVQRLQHAMLNQLENRRQQSIAPGRQFGNYVLEEKLRESSMGCIYRAQHIRLKRPAALKILRADRMNSHTILQFEREVQLTAELRHPHTIAIFDYGHTPDDLFYYAMELVDGLTLADLVRKGGPLPDGRVIAILRQACGSLTEAHGCGMIHRDIKPENIMLSCRAHHPDHVTVLDFGLVASTTDSNTSGETSCGVVGTPLYMSPEAAQGRQAIDARSDLYSLAAVGYFLLTGQPLFTGGTVLEVLQQHILSTPILPSERCGAAISPDLEALLMQCLQKEPQQRPESMQEFEARLSACLPRQPWSEQAGKDWWADHHQSLAESSTFKTCPVNATLVTANDESPLDMNTATLIEGEIARNTVIS